MHVDTTEREIEIQKMVCEIMNLIHDLNKEHTDRLNSFSEKAYYVQQLNGRIDIIMGMRLGAR